MDADGLREHAPDDLMEILGSHVTSLGSICYCDNPRCGTLDHEAREGAAAMSAPASAASSD